MPTVLMMGNRDDDVDHIWLRRCCDHVYGDLIHVNENTTCPSLQADEKVPSESPRFHGISSSAPPRLQYLVVDELLSSQAPRGNETSSIEPEPVRSYPSPTILEEWKSSDLPQVQDVISSSSPVAADENKITNPAPIDESRWSDPPQAKSSTAEDEARASTSASSRRCRPPRDHLVTGYVVRDRKPDRHVPVVNPISSKDGQLLARPDFDVFDEIGEAGHVLEMFWPQPGDILVLQSHRSGIPYPGFDGHVELYVDEYYFRNPDYTWNWAYDFREGDILIRFGTFTTQWRWSPGDSVQVYLRFDDCFVLVGREVNHEFCPLDFKFSDPALRPIHSIQVDFHPRLGDLIVRKDSATPFNWTLFWWKEAFYVSEPFDMLVRAGFVNSDDNIHCFSVAEVYFRNAQNQHWSFQGRDDYTFGGGT